MPTETENQARRPVLVNPEMKVRKRRASANVSPLSADVKPESPPAPAETTPPVTPAVQDGKPDHSLVPIPRKKTLPDAEAIGYWNSVPQRERDAWFIGYVYRDLPVCDPLQPLSQEELRLISSKKKKAPVTNCGKLTVPLSVENWQQEIKDKFGAGEYRIRLNDQHPSITATVVEFEVSGGRDWATNPPVLDPATVVLTDPKNEPYIRWFHASGRFFPGEPGSPENPRTPFDEDEDEMANVSAVVESNKHLTDRVIEMSKEAQKPAPAAAPAPMDQANTRAVEVIADAATKAQKMMLDGIQAAQQSQTKAQDPMEFHKAVTEAARAMNPGSSGGNSEMLVMMQTMMTQQATQFQALMTQQQAANTALVQQLEKRLESAERRAEAAETRAQAAMQPPTPGATSTSQLKETIELLGMVDKLRGAVAPDGTPDADLPVWARVASKVVDNLPDMLHNAAVMWTGKGTPVPPLNPEVIEAENAPPAVEAAQTPQNPPKEEEVFSQNRIAQELAAPLMDAINKQHRGFEFAAGMILQPRIMGFPGRVVYEMAIEQGQDGLLQILQSHPPLWQQLMTIPKRLQTFIVEFMDRDMAYQIAKEAQQPKAAQAPAAVTPEVLPAENPLPSTSGRVVMGPNGPIQTVPPKKGPVVNGPAQTPLSAS